MTANHFRQRLRAGENLFGTLIVSHFWGGVEQQVRFLQMGANLLVHSADLSLFQKHLPLELAAIKHAAGAAGVPRIVREEATL